MGEYVRGLEQIDRTQVALVGGKGSVLGELSRIEGISVPAGFCVTTDAYRRTLAEAASVDDLFDRLRGLVADDLESIRALSADIHRAFEEIAVAEDVTSAIHHALSRFGEHTTYAVRSSATAEDSASASFAGQHDTYLNVPRVAVVHHVVRCWASLFTERAISYRLRNDADHDAVLMAVVVQRMALPRAAGVLFTADPVTSNRRVVSVEASFGLGESLVSGLVSPDVYTVRDGEVVERTIGAKQVAIHPSPAGGTEQRATDPAQQSQPVLADDQVLELARLGRRLEAHFGAPQDIEWCLADEGLQIVQSRPITTLFPIPETADGGNHVYVSVGHQQMMTDPLKPLGLSFWQMTTPRPMPVAAGRLFVDVTAQLASPATCAGVLHALGTSDPLIGDALQLIIDRGDFIPTLDDGTAAAVPPGVGPPVTGEIDASVVATLVDESRASIAALERDIQAQSGPELLQFIAADIEQLRQITVGPRSLAVIMAGMQASWWINDRLQEWLGERNAADTLTQSLPGNVTSEMGLALLDVADAVRPHPEVVALLESVERGEVAGERLLDKLGELPGGAEARDVIESWLDAYGMRCVGEIDITRPRWSERPGTLVPLILSNVRNVEPGAGPRRLEQGRQEAQARTRELLERVRALPDGDSKAQETERMIDRLRSLSGYREYPKYAMVSRYFAYKQALLKEAVRLVAAGVLAEREDVFYLSFQELEEVLRTARLDRGLINDRAAAFRSYESLTPPRVLTSDGETIAGAYRRDDAPAGALLGLPVSAGVIEGRARVILDVAKADLAPGDILVTAYTDPSWTPLFLSIAGLVTEVGGLMTHGAVIAREYGLPAVVGMEHATQAIPDGQRIRVHGTDGYVELL